MKILVTYNLPREAFSQLPADWDITFPSGEEFTKEEIIRLLPEYDILLYIFSRPVDKEMIDAGTKLQLISNFGVGFNNIDIRHARKKGITVCNTPQSVCTPTAELCMALMLGIARRLPELDHRIRQEKESLWGVMKNLGTGLEGKTLGIIGMGRIGQDVARKAAAFDMKIIYYNRHTEVPGYQRVGLDSLLKESDFISLHTPLNEDSNHLIGKKELESMKPSAFLINTARGAVIDEEALAECLQNQRIRGAALDVFEQEPHITEKLYHLNNVILLPHVGTATIDGRIATAKEALQNIRNFLEGHPANIVN
ncbi:MAG: dihydrofolate reductase [Odoribacter sp.]|nr:dihydrofolate reductase [Odoribacter sp.]